MSSQQNQITEIGCTVVQMWPFIEITAFLWYTGEPIYRSLNYIRVIIVHVAVFKFPPFCSTNLKYLPNNFPNI